MTRTTRTKTIKPPEFRARVRGSVTTPGLPADVSEKPGKIKRRDWRVIIADSSEARIYSADAAISRLKLLATVRNPSARTPEHDIISSRGGSKFNRVDGIYQPLAPTSSVHRERNEQFAKAVAAVAARRIGPAEQLALFAGSRLLALIERALPRTASALLARSVPRDVTHEPVMQLRARLRRELGNGAVHGE